MAGSIARAAQALELLLGPAERRDFAVRLWNGRTIAGGAGSRFTLVLNHAGSLRRMLVPPGELTLGEAFVRGDFDVEGDLVAAFTLRDRLATVPRDVRGILRLGQALLVRDPAPPRSGGGNSARLGGRKHTPERDTRAIRHHYDVGNDFYALWLDRRMVYSCAYFADPSTPIDAAQEAKLDLVCRKLRLRPGERLLDIGCGWGGLILHAAERYGATALGITLSEAQAAWARERIRASGLERRCRVEIEDYRELTAEPFDKLVSVGMVEHVGIGRLGEYFRQAARLLRPGGAFLNHGISPGTPRRREIGSVLRRNGKFLDRYVFPDGELPPLHEIERAALEAGLELRDVESLREHYALTLRHWLQRLESRRDDAVRAVGEATYRVWRVYLAGSVFAFETGGNTVFQALYVRPDAGRSGVPLTRADWYSEPPRAAARSPDDASD